MPIVHLQRVVAGIPAPLTNINTGVSSVRNKVNGRRQVVDQDLLYVAIAGRIAPLSSRERGHILSGRADRNLVHVAIANDMPSQASHIAHSQEVIAAELVLHP